MKMTQDKTREIVEDFAKAILEKKTTGTKPSKTVIDFRQEKEHGFERDIENVPLDLLRYRKENGRISSDVLSYERSYGELSEIDSEAQEILGEYLAKKDPEKTQELEGLIYARGQETPAIITCDGFLIDGNRRRYVLGRLKEKYPEDSRFQTMKVVLLPGPGEQGGLPRVKEIEKIENRYQLQSDGKADYSGFDAALSIRQKEKRDFPIEEQLKDDPRYVALGEKQFEKVVREKKKALLLPLDCVDRYLNQLGRPGQYKHISSGVGDREGRWQSFVDYSSMHSNTLKSAGKRQRYGIEEEDIGDIGDAAFKIIRLRELGGIVKPHMVMRKLPAFWKNAKDHILAISNLVDDDIPDEQRYDQEGEILPIEQQDKIWAANATPVILSNLREAMRLNSEQQVQETPVTLLEAALKKLRHEQMDIECIISEPELRKARGLTSKIQREAKELEGEIYTAIKRKNTKK